MSSQTNALASPASAALGAILECPVLIPEDNGDSHHIPEDNRDSYHPTLDHSGASLVQSRAPATSEPSFTLDEGNYSGLRSPRRLVRGRAAAVLQRAFG